MYFVRNQNGLSVIMRISVKTALLFVVFYSCVATKPSLQTCSGFRTGRYIFSIYNESGVGHWKKITYFINRADTLEIVTSNHFPQDTLIYKITWTGACEYKSFLLNPKLGLDSFLIRQYPTGTSHRIVKMTDEYFLVKNSGREDTLWKAR